LALTSLLNINNSLTLFRLPGQTLLPVDVE